MWKAFDQDAIRDDMSKLMITATGAADVSIIQIDYELFQLSEWVKHLNIELLKEYRQNTLTLGISWGSIILFSGFG